MSASFRIAANRFGDTGFDSCAINGFEPAQYTRILGLPAHLVPTALCPVGYAAGTPYKKLRFPLQEIII